ncbi:Uncharacterised protein [Canicola haemoglobinophilus]|uniref:DUF4194 domain-containing protein n=1 Tax=Canicola haemoglobinophilus TaxID=733 RepID=A0AB38HDC8_9PAST|nr:DUF4194 domain-containing protein [Canicola haemoglobinophilus]STO54845.1 Uncharacterised protein [Canicola haemoglobinophilus]STO69584.1 Uncharacterised protein [Canicola haemoglobinophilus]
MSFFTSVTGITKDNQQDEQSPNSNNPVEEKQREDLQIEGQESNQENTPQEIASPFVMPEEARRVLVYLYKQIAILNSQTPHLFAALCRYEQPIRQHLAEVYLQLVLDEQFGVAFIKMTEADIDDETELPLSLMSKRQLSLYDSLILLVLRKHYREREDSGEKKIVIDIERLEAYLSPFVPLTDHASKDRKKLLAKVKDLQKRKLLASVAGSEDRFEITPLLRYVVSAEMLDTMLQAYLELAQNGETLQSEEE